MTTHLWVLAAALGVTGPISWGALVRRDVLAERLTRPLVGLVLLGLAWSLHLEGAVDGAPGLVPVLVALSLSLVADLALLNATSGRFLVALLALGVANLAWGWSMVGAARAGGFPWLLLLALPAVVLVHARVGRQVVLHAGTQRMPVFLHELSLLGLVLVAAWRGDALVLGGCALLAVSGAVLGHDRFALERRWAPLAALVTSHLAQLLVVVGLYR
ncbi:MAG: lysoplasmalogenase family protein [Humibacillus sp.]